MGKPYFSRNRVKAVSPIHREGWLIRKRLGHSGLNSRQDPESQIVGQLVACPREPFHPPLGHLKGRAAIALDKFPSSRSNVSVRDEGPAFQWRGALSSSSAIASIEAFRSLVLNFTVTVKSVSMTLVRSSIRSRWSSKEI